MLCSRALMPRDPAGDLGPGVEAELVQDAADVAVHGALGNEQACPDLLVAQAFGDQPSHVGLPPPEPAKGAVAGLAGSRGSLAWLARRQCDRPPPAQPLTAPDPRAAP